MSAAKAATALGFDLGKEIESAVEDLGVFGEGATNAAWDSTDIVRSRTATWQNIAARVQELIGNDFQISGATIRHCVAARRVNSAVAKLHNPIAAVSRRKFVKQSQE